MKFRLATLCLMTALAAPAWATDAEVSGFLSDYSKLQAVEGNTSAKTYTDSSVDFSKYSKLYFRPSEIMITPNPEYKGMQPDTFKRMTDNLDSAFKNAVMGKFEVVGAPGPDVLTVRLAISGVQPARTDMGITDFIPIKALFNVARSAAGASPKVAEMAGEMEVLDPSGKVVLAATSTRKGDTTLAQNDKVTWQEMSPIMQHWATNFTKLMTDLRAGKK
jgi:hypothetical protein